LPHRVVISSRNIAQNKVEYRLRQETENSLLTAADLIAKLM